MLRTAILFSFVNVSAQEQQLADSLKEVRFSNKKNPSSDERVNQFSSGQKILTLDSALLAQYKNQSVANLLTQQTPVFIRSYGFNGLATMNIRGASAAQSQVFWNGVPVNNAALGMADVSALPVAMVQKLHIVYGSSAALWGSGNVGGAILLENETPVFSKKRTLETTLATGSFGQYIASVQTGVSGKRFSAITNIFTQTAQNDFRYTTLFDEEVKTSNARLRGTAIQQQLAYTKNSKDVFRLIGWYQHYYREIPAALFESYSEKLRKDEAVRVMLDWNRKSSNKHSYARLAFLQDRMDYRDDTIRLITRGTSYQSFAEIGFKKSLSEKHKLLLFAPLQYSWIYPDAQVRYQTKLAIAASYTYQSSNRKLAFSMNLREELINHRAIFLPGLGANYSLNHALSLRFNFQRTFRVPTLNELYYNPGGNKDLKPEQGWSGDIGYKLETNVFRKLGLLHDVSAFSRIIDDWIIWLGGAVWTPHNIASVYSRGLETQNYISFPLRKTRIHLGINAAYVVATTVSSYLPGDGSIGKQIPYTPRLNGQINLGFTSQSVSFNYNHNFTGSRYVNVDETGIIDAYQTSNLQLTYSFKIKANAFSLTGQANNIFNHNYEVVTSRPMPGFNWMLSLRFSSNLLTLSGESK